MNRNMLLVVAATLTVAVATDASPEPNPFSRETLAQEKLLPSKSIGKVVSQRIEMAAGARAPIHLHPVPVVGYVVSGEIAYAIKGGETLVLKSGDAFFEAANTVVERWENVGAAEAVFVAHYLVGSEDSVLTQLIE